MQTMAQQPVRARKFLVVVDETPESRVAIRFATRRAQHTNGHVSLFCAADHDDFQQWRGVEELMREEARAKAEKLVLAAAKVVNELAGIFPEFVILHGAPVACLTETLKVDSDISVLVLASGTAQEAQGPLIAAFVGEASAHPIPVTIVPGTLSDDEIDSLA